MVFTTLYNVYLYVVAYYDQAMRQNRNPGTRLRNLYIENKSELKYLQDKVARQEKIIKSLKMRLEYEISQNNKNNTYQYELNVLRTKGEWVTLDEKGGDG